jgi:selenocysteine-specific elongation factor
MIVATAGHVDHGKTSLVKALTGVDTDRLPEEKRRGLTIDLGFAYLPLAAGPVIGFVDVPGHERFIHNMLSGIAGIDFALLVVAADDGPMPQTLEHLAILELLGVSRGAVALSKIDRVDAERVAEVASAIAALLAPTRLAGACLYPVSAVSGAGVSALREHLEREASRLPARLVEGNFRLSIDRAFSIAGAGLVVTGTALSGEVTVGDHVRVLLAGLGARVRSIRAQHAPAERGRAGQRCALNLAGFDGKAPIERGDWIVAGNVAPAVRRLDARLRVLVSEAVPLAHWSPVHVHLGAADVTGRVAVLEGPAIAPSESGLVQLHLERPIGAVQGDRFIVRDQSSRRTLGGGSVIDVFPPARGRARPERLAVLAATELDDHAAALGALLGASPGGVDLARFAANRNLLPAAAERLYARVPTRKAGNWGFAPAQWTALRSAALAALQAWHRRSPDRVGPPEDRILQGAEFRVPREVVVALVEELAREGAIVREGMGVRLPGHRMQLGAADAGLWQRTRALLEASALRPPSVAELAAELREDARRLDSALSRLERHGLVVRVSRNRFFLPETLRRLEQIAKQEARASGSITAAGFRDRARIGRNLAIEILEFFDRIKFTRRAGDTHVLVRAADGTDSGRDTHPGGAPGLQIQ